MPEPESSSSSEEEELELARIVERLVARREAGLDLEMTQLAADRPELAGELRRLLPAIEAIVALGPEDSIVDDLRGGLPEVIGDFRLEREIGRGGMGVVFEATQISLGRRVALKVLGTSLMSAPRARARFRREAGVASRLNHPGICPVYDAGEADGIPYIAMAFVDGEGLSRHIDRRWPERGRAASDTTPPTLPRQRVDGSWALELIAQVARTLHAAHEAGVVHRDIKPSNVLITRDGRPVIVDFGLARDLEGDEGTLTRTGEIQGTPSYMAPEQLDARYGIPDRRTDIYALGVTLFEALTGEVPFTGATRDALYRRILDHPPRELTALNPDVSRDLRVIVETALAKDPDHRYQTASMLAEDLERTRRGEPILARPVSALTRIWRRARRHPLAASLIVLVALMIPTLASLATFVWLTEDERRAGEQARRREESRGLVIQAFRWLDQPDAKRRLDLARRALELDPGSALALWSAVDGLRIADRRSEALRLLDAHPETLERHHSFVKLRALLAGEESESPAGPPSAIDHFLVGRARLLRAEQGEPEMALKAWEAFTDAVLHSEAPPLLFHFGRVRAAGMLRRKDLLDPAARALRTRAPDRGDTALWLGLARFRVGERERGIALLEEAVARLRDSVPPLVQLSNALRFVGRLEDAERRAQEACALAPESALAWQAVAEVGRARGDETAALDAYRRAVASAPRNLRMKAALAHTLADFRQYEEARRLVDEGLQVDPRHVEMLQLDATLLSQSGEFDDAIARLQTLLEIRPSDGRVRVALGRLLLETGDGEAAERELARAAELTPSDPIVHFTRGDALLRMRRTDDAVEALERAAELAPHDVDVLLLLAEALTRSGQPDEALQALGRARPLCRKSADRERLERLESTARRRQRR